jgi:hypothetical protein
VASSLLYEYTEGEYDMKKEMFFGLLWGLALGLLTVALLISTAKSAVLSGDDGGTIDISISGDSVTVNIDKDGTVRSVTVRGDSLARTTSGIKVENDLLIENGKIYIDGVELTEQELKRLSINEDEKSDEGWQRSNHGHKQIKRKRLVTIYSDSGDLVKFGDVVVDSTAKINGDVVSISGNITIFGEVSGDVVSVFGNVYLKDGANIRGDVAAPMGKVEREPNIVIKGNLESHKNEKKGQVAMGMSARFNRVEGFTLMPTLNFEDNKNRLPKVNIICAYAFTLKRWEYDFGIEHRFSKGFMPYFDIHLFQLAESPDSWRFDETENTIAGLFFKEDFWDFNWSRGFKGEAGLYLTDDIQAGGLFEASRISNLERTAGKAIFGGKKRFRENWSTILPDSAEILEMKGDLKEAGVKLGYDTRIDKTKPSQSGTIALIEWRKTLDASSFKYQLTTAEARTFLPIAANQVLILRLRGGYSDDNLPLFRRFFIGGIGSLRGYDYKEFEGNRYALFSSDYVWRFFHSDFGAGVFFDTGKAAQSGHEFSSSNPKSDIGISFLIEDAFRLDLAQRLDDLDRHPVVSARLELPL